MSLVNAYRNLSPTSPICIATAAALTYLSSHASAQDIAAAEALFNKGASELNAGRYDAACPALAESYRLDPRPGALFTLAECENKRGAIATAVARYEEFLRLAAGLPSPQRDRQAERVLIASQQKERLTPDVPTLTLRLGSTLGPATSITRDGTAVGAASLDVPIPVDPGEHRIVVVPPTGKPHEFSLRVARGERRVLELAPDQEQEPAPPTPPPPPVVPGPAPTETATSSAPMPLTATIQSPPPKVSPPPTASAPSAPAAQNPTTDLRKLSAYALGGLGLAAVAVGSTAGALALARKKTVDDNCVDLACNPVGLDALDQGRTFASVSTATLVVGSAAVAGGALLWITAPSSGGGPARSVGLLPSFNGSAIQLHVGGLW